MIRSRMMRSTTARSCVTALCIAQVAFVTQAPLQASERRLAGSVIEVHQKEGLFVDPANKSSAGIKDKPVYVLKKGDSVTIIVVDQNPLLFTYGVEVTRAETEQHKIASQFAKTLSDLLQPFQNLRAGGAGKTLTVEGLDLTRLQSDLAELNGDLAAIPGKIAQSIGSDADVAAMKTDVAAWHVDELVQRLTSNLPKLTQVAAKCLAGRPLNAGDGSTISCLAPLDPDAERQVKPPAADPPPAVEPPAAPPAAPAKGAQGGPRRPGSTPLGGQPPPNAPAPPSPAPQPAAPAQTQTIQAFVTLALALQTRTEDSLPILTGFAADVAAVNTPLNLACKDQPACQYSLDEQTIAVKIGRSAKYDAFLTDPVKKVQQSKAGDYAFVLTPYTPAIIGLAPAFVILFVSNPTFKAVKSGDQYVIQAEDKGQPGGFNVAAMLTITPKSWSEPTFGGQFQVGVSPTKDKVGFYFGVGMHVQERFTFGAGVALQQVTRLTAGLSENQTIASADLLKTELPFKPGLYVHITANLK